MIQTPDLIHTNFHGNIAGNLEKKDISVNT